jgi:hypothetical protein
MNANDNHPLTLDTYDWGDKPAPLRVKVDFRYPEYSSINDALLGYASGTLEVIVDDRGEELGRTILNLLGANSTEVRVTLLRS